MVKSDYEPRLLTQYRTELVSMLAEKLGRKNILSLPRLQKIVVNMGVGAAKSVAGFKLREGQPIGCKVTLRGKRMYEFLDRLISMALPRVRDFRGLDPNGFDRHGNYNLGLSEQLVFPELNPDKINRVQGMTINLVTSASKDDEARELLRGFGMPFKSEDSKKP